MRIRPGHVPPLIAALIPNILMKIVIAIKAIGTILIMLSSQPRVGSIDSAPAKILTIATIPPITVAKDVLI
jgi:hypothetical protein